MDMKGKFSTYRVDTQKEDVKLDLVVAMVTPTLDGSCHISRLHVWTKTHKSVRYLIDQIGENTYLSFARNMCVHKAKETAVKRLSRLPDYYLWVDQDNVCPDDLFFRLHQHDKDIVSGSYVRKGGAYEWVFRPTAEERNWEAEGKRGLVECRYVGFGACLVKGEVFEKLKMPWFEEGTSKEKVDGKIRYHETGEDVYFCDKAREAGYKVWVDTDCHVGHTGAVIWPKDAYRVHAGTETTGQADYVARKDTIVHCEKKERGGLS